MKRVLDWDNIQVDYNEEKNYLYLNWIGFQTEDKVYESGNAVVKLMKEYTTCHHVINDNRNVQGPWNKAADWTQNVWFPQMIESGLNKFAWIFPSNIFAQLSAEQAMPDNDLVTKFQNYEDAEKWLG